MGLYYNLPVYKASYKLMDQLFIISSKFSREYKYTVGQELKIEGYNLIKNIYRANKATDKTIYIGQARENVELIKLLFRLMKLKALIQLFADLKQALCHTVQFHRKHTRLLLLQ